MPVPHVNHLQRPPEATWLPRPALGQDILRLPAQQSSHQLPTTSSFQGSAPSVTAMPLAGLERITEELTSGSGLSPMSQSASDAPADRLGQTSTPPAPEPTTSVPKKPRIGRPLVNPVTGKTVLDGTQGIPFSTFRNRMLVDPDTGKPIRPGAANGISTKRFRNNRLVHPVSGESVPPGTKGAITIQAFKARQRRYKPSS
jgi:hypothetical protein